MEYWLGRTCAVFSDFYRKEVDRSKAKKNLTKAIEILTEYGETVGCRNMRRSWLSFHEINSTESRFLFGFVDVSTYLGYTKSTDFHVLLWS